MYSKLSKEQLVKYAQLDLLNEVKRICDKNNINYFLSYGTLLGAVRHKGFIPWDDDIDVGFLKNDYDRFINCCEKDLSSEYELINWNVGKSIPHPFYKLKIKNTKYIEQLAINNNSNNGIFIDLFAFQDIPNNKIIRLCQCIKITLIRKAMLLKCNYDIIGQNTIKKIVYIPFKIYNKLNSKEKLIDKYNTVLNRKQKSSARYVMTDSHANPFKTKEFIPKKWLNEMIIGSFEGEEYKIPKEYDYILKLMYNDYMKLPPIEKRKSPHKIINIDFGKYVIKSIKEKNE